MSSPLRTLTVALGDDALSRKAFGTSGSPSTAVPLSLEGLSTRLGSGFSQCWIRRGEGQLGFGEAARFTVNGSERFIEAEAWWKQLVLDAEVRDEVRHPGTGPLAFGSFGFSRTSPYDSRLIVPELVLGLRDGRPWATLQTIDGTAPEESALRAAIERWTSDAAPVRASGSRHLLPGSLGEDSWKDAVAAGVERIRAGELEKLVLARDILAQDDAGVDRGGLLARLCEAYRDCWVYGVDGLVGATPEMLIQVEGRTAQARVLAGTLDRRDAEGRDPGFPERVLAGSGKQRHEHRIAIESLTQALQPFTEALSAHEEPFILELPNVFHLASDVKAELTEVEGHVPTALALVNALHPTAAVCGTPTRAAGLALRELEKMDRGPYAGPVGWIDGAGNGEWGIALRGGVIESATTVRLYAGCGIVEASQPEAELAESWAKFRPMLEALGIERPEATSHLGEFGIESA